ncbi:MAG TPA: Clp1/GlmU family protein [Armatimonadota bacterium]|jgi:polynucleotide 5'-hydroxyl-kinase GRC3/NOL9
MDVPAAGSIDRVLESPGPVLLLGAADTGKTALMARLARAFRAAGRPAAALDLDVGQSEIGPPGLIDLAEADAEAPPAKWRARGQWYVGSTTPFGAPTAIAVGARRLLDRATELDLGPVVVDTPSFVNAPAGHALAQSLIDALRPRLIVAIQLGAEMEPFLKGVGAPVERMAMDPAVRSKPSGLRSARRAARLDAYFRDAREHSIRLPEWALRGTRLGFGDPLAPAECASAANLLGCPVRHGERSSSSVALWTLGQPRYDPARAGAELRASRLATFDAAAWEHRSAGFIAPDGFCVAMGVIERVDWASLTATVYAPLYSVADAVAISLGLMRHNRDGSGLPPVADRDA